MSDDAALLHELAAKDRLHALEMAYCRGVDRRDAALLGSIFWDDATESHGEMYAGSAAAFVRWAIEEFLPRFETTAHYVLNEWYAVDGARAEGETHRVSYHRERAADGSARETFAACRTFNRYECRGGIWRIAHRAVARDWLVERAADPAERHAGFGMPPSRPDETDLSYRLLSLFGRGALA